ncbi:hypothetical protein [uncultured Lamprocystis sp.]|nr:hypothetical protein [uncultured Lamprocystis sp.]
MASQETGIRAAGFPTDCPYRAGDILSESYWPSDSRG